jgi:hypothetical protein
VSGSLTEKRIVDGDGRLKPENKQQYEFGIAFPKTDPDMQRLFGEFHTYLSDEWSRSPDRLQALETWFGTMGGLSMKISDGDKPNQKGKVNPNTTGHFVFWFSSSYPTKAVNTTYDEIDASDIVRGYYVRIAGNISDNGEPIAGAGIYMNPTVIQLVAEGDEIRGGIDAKAAFGGSAVSSLPTGARPVGSGLAQVGKPPSVGMPGLPGGPQTTSVGMPGLPGGPQTTSAPFSGQTTSHIDPHTSILSGPGGAVPQAARGLPGLPGMPGQ